jgi:hypothetical protein
VCRFLNGPATIGARLGVRRVPRVILRGPAWGDQGFGWLPYAFLRERLAIDFWTLVNRDRLLSGEFKRPLHRR